MPCANFCRQSVYPRKYAPSPIPSLVKSEFEGPSPRLWISLTTLLSHAEICVDAVVNFELAEPITLEQTTRLNCFGQFTLALPVADEFDSITDVNVTICFNNHGCPDPLRPIMCTFNNHTLVPFSNRDCSLFATSVVLPTDNLLTCVDGALSKGPLVCAASGPLTTTTPFIVCATDGSILTREIAFAGTAIPCDSEFLFLSNGNYTRRTIPDSNTTFEFQDLIAACDADDGRLKFFNPPTTSGELCSLYGQQAIPQNSNLIASDNTTVISSGTTGNVSFTSLIIEPASSILFSGTSIFGWSTFQVTRTGLYKLSARLTYKITQQFNKVDTNGDSPVRAAIYVAGGFSINNGKLLGLCARGTDFQLAVGRYIATVTSTDWANREHFDRITCECLVNLISGDTVSFTVGNRMQVQGESGFEVSGLSLATILYHPILSNGELQGLLSFDNRPDPSSISIEQIA